jgi:hypothetical protein
MWFNDRRVEESLQRLKEIGGYVSAPFRNVIHVEMEKTTPWIGTPGTLLSSEAEAKRDPAPPRHRGDRWLKVFLGRAVSVEAPYKVPKRPSPTGLSKQAGTGFTRRR